jgi:hypothetical protein
MVAERTDVRTRSALRSIEGSATRREAREAWGRVRVLGNRVHLAVVAERPDIADGAAGELVSLADRRLRQIGGNDAA